MYKSNHCRKCGRHISVHRVRLGLCEWCEKEQSIPHKDGKASNESLAHIKLKDRAVSFLISHGCHPVKKEVHKGFRYDVMGWLENDIYVVECGGCNKDKLDDALYKGYHLFIWPYGASNPIKYDKSMQVCHCCGAIIGNEK